MDPVIILCDDNGTPTGEYVPKEVGHTGNGKHHLAITVLLSNSKGQVLLQKRKHKRFDGLWDLTGATDLRHFNNESNESFENATLRCLKNEYGIEKVNNLRKIGAFNYFAPYHTVQGEFCENEHCAMMIGVYDGEIKMDPSVGYEFKWIDQEQFLEDIEENPKKYTPWANKAFDILKKVVLT